MLLAQLAIGLTIAFGVAGIAWHGLSGEVLGRVRRNILDRPGGPMTFRFVLQPVMAAAAALVDGIAAARPLRASRPLVAPLTLQPAGRLARRTEPTTKQP